MPKEAKARILINDLLRRSGWRFFDNAFGPANIALEANVKLKKKALDVIPKEKIQKAIYLVRGQKIICGMMGVCHRNKTHLKPMLLGHCLHLFCVVVGHQKIAF